VSTNNPFLFASSSSADPFATPDALFGAPSLAQGFNWSQLLVTLAEERPTLSYAMMAAPEPAAPTVAISAEETPIAPVPVAAEASPPAAAPVAAPAPAIVTIAEPAPLPAPVPHVIPATMPPDPAFDAYARLFQGIEDRDLLADLHATIAPGSDWSHAFGPPLG